MKLTKMMIEAGQSERGGYNRRQLALIGVEWHGTKGPKPGWKERAAGQEISARDYAEFLSLTGKTKRPPRKRVSKRKRLFPQPGER